jgi:phosphatidylglycerol---prolipoprotein diacylglyceryl transferase
VYPRLFQIGHFSLPTYGLLVAIGVLLGLLLSVRNSQRLGINPEDTWNLGIVVVLAGILGAKILLIVNDWSFYTRNPGEIFSMNTLRSGGVFSGGLLAGLAAAAWYIAGHKMRPLRTCDAFAPGLAIGHAIGRLGCFAAGCCYGKETHAAWGVVFTNPLANAWANTPLNVRLEPTQLIEAVVEFLNFLLLSWLITRKHADGQIFGTYLILYGIARFFIEFLRGDDGRGLVFGGIMSGTQLIAIILVIVGGLFWLRRTPHPKIASAS